MRLHRYLELRPAYVAGLVLLAGIVLPPEVAAGGPVLCPFRLLTGLPCPGCGLTRSLVCLLHGDLATSVAFHPLGPLVALALIGFILAEACARARPALRDGPWQWSLALRLRSAAPWATLAAFLLVWIVRLPLYLQGRWLY